MSRLPPYLQYVPNREQLAWAAGFFDGEGWVGIVQYSCQGRKYTRISAHVAQTNLSILHRFQTTIGRGTVNGPYRVGRKNHKPYWTYQTSGIQDTQHLIAVLWTWLADVKRVQAKTALSAIGEYYRRVKEKPGSKPGQRAADRARKLQKEKV
jgi:hypothetical protein